MSAGPPRLISRTFPVILAAPSGTGKTTIARELGRRRADLDFSISCTTRAPRPSERDGVDYHFRSVEEFREMIASDALLEWAEVHGCLYGTPRANLVQAQAKHHFLLLDIDVQGSRQVKQAVPEAVSIFVLPPNGRELAKRLRGRGSEPLDVQHRRLIAARNELSAAPEYDYVLVNDDVHASAEAVERIISAESMRATRLTSLSQEVSGLIAEIDHLLQIPTELKQD